MTKRFTSVAGLVLIQAFLVSGILNINITTESTETSITLSWNDDIPTYSNYSVEISSGGNQIFLLDPASIIFTFDNLQSGNLYTFIIIGYTSDENSTLIVENSTSINVTTKPLPPQFDPPFFATTTAITLTWSPDVSSSPDGYQIVYHAVGELQETETGVTSETTLVIDPLDPGRHYTFYVLAISHGVKSNWSNEANDTTVPLKASGVTVDAINTDTLNIKWTYPSYYDSFSVYVNGTVTTCEDTPCRYTTTNVPGSLYAVTIETVSGNRRSPPTAAVPQNTIPNPPTDLQRASVEVNQMKVDWLAPANSLVDGYDVFISSNDTTPISNQTAIAATSATFDSLSAGVQYRFVVVARSGEQRSAELLGTFYTKPHPVQDPMTLALNTLELSVSWNTKDTMQSYFVIVASNPEMNNKSYTIPVNGGTSYNVTIDNMEPGYTFDIQVFAVAGDGHTESDHVSTRGTTYPWTVGNVSVTADGTTAHVTWDPYKAGFQDSFLIHYRPRLRDSQAMWLQNSTNESEVTLDNLFPGEDYEFKIYPISNGLIGDSQFQEASVIIAPLGPIALNADRSLATTDSVTLNWDYDLSQTHLTHWVVEYNSLSIVVNYTDQTTIHETIPGLESGRTYAFSVYAVTQTTYSQIPATVTATAKPVCFANLTEDVAGTTTSDVAVQFSHGSNMYTKYIFTIHPGAMTDERMKDNPTHVVFKTLSAGQEYNVSVVAESDGIISEAQSIAIWTRPNVPVLTANNGANFIELFLGKPHGMVEFYNVSCATCNVKYMEVELNSPHANFSGLDPFEYYTFEIVSHSGPKKSEILQSRYQTGQAAPSIVRDVIIVEIDKLTAKVRWTPPAQMNGDVLLYEVSFDGRLLEKVHTGTQNVDGKLDTEEFQLRAGYTYTFWVKAQTVTFGEAGMGQITMLTYSPSLKIGITMDQTRAINRTVSESLYAYQSIAVEFPDVFSEEYGVVVNYAVIVATNPQDSHTKDTVLPGWKSYKDAGAIAYQAVSNCSADFFTPGSQCDIGTARKRRSVNNPPKVFTVGTEDCSSSNKEYCNGYLTPETAYYVKLRAFTTGGFSDTEYSVKIVTVAKPDNTGLIVGVIFGVLIVGALLVLGGFILKRKKIFTKRAYRHDSPHNMTPRSSMRRVKSSRKIKLSEFQDHYRLMAADSDFRFAEEYEDLREIGRDQPCTVAELPVNRGKNRFTNILPYDHSRVKLLPTDDEEGSDYINANYMPGFSSKREYIVTQGPLPSTRDDFWRMIWEQNCRNLVMLTRCVEKSREKCDQYWPQSSEPVLYGDLQVAALNESRFPEWTMTEFKVSLGDQSRQVRHFHFTAWPDFGVPERPQSLVKFVRTVRGKLFKECGPILVHCSAGVGRSGTFIALDRLLQQVAEAAEQVDVYGIVSEMRVERVWMVQTEQQYICIHQCLSCVLEGREEENIYQNVAHVNVAFEAMSSSLDNEDDEGINVEIT